LSPIILGLSWLEKYNLQFDWSNCSITFLPKKPIVLELVVNPPISHHQKLQKPLYIGARAFTRVAKNSIMFAVYATPTTNTTIIVLLKQYEAYEDVFEKKNEDILPQYQPYNCTIHLKKGA